MTDPLPPAPSWSVTHRGIPSTSEEIPDFPMIRFDAGASVYQEVLINGQYLGAGMSAMGLARARSQIWSDLHGGAASFAPLRRWQNAFEVEVDGQRLVDGWELIDHADEGAEAVVCLRHPQRSIGVEVRTAVGDTPFLARRLVIRNEGERPCALSRVQPWCGMVWTVRSLNDFSGDVDMRHFPGGPFSVGRMTNSAMLTEGAFEWTRAPMGRLLIESVQGRSGASAPFAIVRNDATGEALILDLAWSGNWNLELHNDWEPHRATGGGSGGEPFNVNSNARFYASIGITGPTPLRVLDPGESAATPIVHLATLFGGLDDAVHALHGHIRTSVVPAQPAGREQRVEFNHTGTTFGKPVTREWLYDEIDIAADLGFELFMLDAGWFGNGELDWLELVGDWTENPHLAGGVRAALDHARSKGLLAGLWMEPERFGRRSRIIAEHPEWLMHRRAEPIPNIDLSIPAAAAHFEQTVVSTIEKYALDCFRLDYNINIGEGGTREHAGYTESTLWRHYDALYEIFERIRRRFPNLLLENCASGGSRNDLGMMARFHYADVTDRFSSSLALRILNGTTIALPPELCEGVMGAFGLGVTDVDFMVRANMFTHFNVSGIAPSLAERNEVSWARWRHGIQLYKDFCRPMLRNALMFHHTPIQRQTDLGEWLVLENASPTRDRAYAGVFRLLDAQDDVYVLRPRGLDPSRSYRVVYDSTQIERDIDGGRLTEEGIGIRIPSAYRSELVLFEAH
jgi:alpha-galactosidase